MPIFEQSERTPKPTGQPSSFRVSTGGISESYETVNVVFARVGVPAPAFGTIDKDKVLRQAIDTMATQAQKMGCNGVIWIRFDDIVDTATAFIVYASGTAVKVRERCESGSAGSQFF